MSVSPSDVSDSQIDQYRLVVDYDQVSVDLMWMLCRNKINGHDNSDSL
jgi:hypothetical protein